VHSKNPSVNLSIPKNIFMHLCIQSQQQGHAEETKWRQANIECYMANETSVDGSRFENDGLPHTITEGRIKGKPTRANKDHRCYTIEQLKKGSNWDTVEWC